jgi:RNA polymerase sigma factor (sigma-70 family)
MTDDRQLLEQYACDRSEPAFAELVRRHVDLVYSAALRLVAGDQALAQDVTQQVFIDLARKARALPPDVRLAGWLYRHTGYTAAKAVRSERRRKSRERAATEMNPQAQPNEPEWERIAPHLDAALHQLKSVDRDAIILRFFNRQDFRTVAAAFGISEAAAQMRVTRALEKLRTLLRQRGVAVLSASLGTSLATQMVIAAPAHWAAGITSASLAASAGATGFSVGFCQLMTTTKLKASVLALFLVAGVATPLVIHHRAQTHLAARDRALRIQAGQLAQWQRENSRLRDAIAEHDGLDAPPQGELLRLRAEVAGWRAKAAALENASEEANALREQLAALESQLKTLNAESVRGRFRLRSQWADKGNADPFATVETMLWAVSSGQESRLAAVATSEAMAETRWPIFPVEHPPVQSVGAVNLIDAFQNQEGTRAAVTAFVREDFIAPPGGSPYSVNKLKGWQMAKSADGWKITKSLFFDIGRD